MLLENPALEWNTYAVGKSDNIIQITETNSLTDYY